MSKLPKLNWKAASASQQRQLAAWLRAWRIAVRLQEVPGPQASKAKSTRTDIGQCVSPFAPEPPSAGQIRLLSSRVLPRATRPVYVAILKNHEQGVRLAAPYGRFSQPAFEGELLTG